MVDIIEGSGRGYEMSEPWGLIRVTGDSVPGCT